jgi:hypothetical protein
VTLLCSFVESLCLTSTIEVVAMLRTAWVLPRTLQIHA